MGVCRTTDDLRAILRARFHELGVSFETVDNVAGLPARYTSKVLGLQPTRNFGQISLDALLPTAAIMLIAGRGGAGAYPKPVGAIGACRS